MGYDVHGRAGECTAPRAGGGRSRAPAAVGHFPTRFAELAQGFADNGCAVEVLTSHGWLHDGERPVPFVVNRYGRFNRLLYRAGESFRDTRVVHRYARALRAVGLVRAAESRCRQAGDPVPDVVVVGMVDPIVASAFAGHGRWLFCEADPPRHVLGRLSRRAVLVQRRRRSIGGTRESRLRTTSTARRGVRSRGSSIR